MRNKQKLIEKHLGIIEHFYGDQVGGWNIKCTKKDANEVLKLCPGLYYNEDSGTLGLADDAKPDPEVMALLWKTKYENLIEVLDEAHKVASKLKDML